MSTDLFGQPIADPPPMNAPLPWRVFRMSDISEETEWILARTEQEAVAFYVEFNHELGDCRTEAEMREDGDINNVHELTDAELDRDYGDPNGPDCDTFAQALAHMASHAKQPMFFATTGY